MVQFSPLGCQLHNHSTIVSLSLFFYTVVHIFIGMNTIYTESGTDIDPSQEGVVEPSLNLGAIVSDMKVAIEHSRALERRAKEAETNEEACDVFTQLIQRYKLILCMVFIYDFFSVASVKQTGNKWNKALVFLTSDV